MATRKIFTPDRPAIRYYGGKWKIADWICSFFPDHSVYVEPFAGALSVLLHKQPSKIEVANDINREVIDFFDILRTREQEFIRAIECTPFSRFELERARESSADPLENARRFYIRAWQSWAGPVAANRSGWRFEKARTSWKTIMQGWNGVDHLWAIAARLKLVRFECDDALRIIDRYDGPDTLFYIDPPYLESTRSRRWSKVGYGNECDEEYHKALLEKLLRAKGSAVVSGYETDLYRKMLVDDAGWEMRSVMSRTMNKEDKKEHLWLSPKALRGRSQILMHESGTM